MLHNVTVITDSGACTLRSVEGWLLSQRYKQLKRQRLSPH